MLAGFAIVFVAILFWRIPWLPYGLSAEDYNDRVTMLMALVVLASLTAFGTVYYRDLGRRVDQTILTWSSVHNGLGDLRQREYFYDRIVIECDRAQAARGEFTVVALRLDEAESDEVKEVQNSEKALRALAPTAKEADCLAALGPNELGVLAPHTKAPDAAAYAERLRDLVTLTVDASLLVRVGWSVYPTDAEEAGALVGLARKRLLNPRQPDGDATPAEQATADYQAIA